MPTYQTKFVKNLTTGEPISLEVPQNKIDFLEEVREQIIRGEANPDFGTTDEFTQFIEFTFFPAFEELLKIFYEDGYTDELMTQILTEFGLEQNVITKLLTHENFVPNVRVWFKGVAGDGEIAARILQIVYLMVKSLIIKREPEWVTGAFLPHQ